MGKFNYQEYLADNYLLKESLGEARKPSGPATAADLKGFATKDATLNREKRAQKGNWKGSLGKFVEEHGPEIQQAVDSRSLTNYVENTMMPALGPEAQEYLDDLISRSRSDAQLLFGLYNVALKGQGLGLHEEYDGLEGEGVGAIDSKLMQLAKTDEELGTIVKVSQGNTSHLRNGSWEEGESLQAMQQDQGTSSDNDIEYSDIPDGIYFVTSFDWISEVEKEIGAELRPTYTFRSDWETGSDEEYWIKLGAENL